MAFNLFTSGKGVYMFHWWCRTMTAFCAPDRSSLLGASTFTERIVLDVHLSTFGICCIWPWHKYYIKRTIPKKNSLSMHVFSLICLFFLQTEGMYLKLLKPMKLDAVDAAPSLIWMHHNYFKLSNNEIVHLCLPGPARWTGSTHRESTCLPWPHYHLPCIHASSRSCFHPPRDWTDSIDTR